MGGREGGGDVDVERGGAEKVNPELECERNSGNGGVFLCLEREKESKRAGGGGGLGREEDPGGAAEHSCLSLAPQF